MAGQQSLPGEFELIGRYFAPLAATMPGSQALMDDACVWTPRPGFELVFTADALIAGVHFLPKDPPGHIARKMLRVNLSDLAAKGANPVGYLMTLALSPEIDEPWIAAFCAGLAEDQAEFRLSLMGGDTVATTGPLSLSLTAIGDIAPGKAMRRNAARVGDAVYVTGTIGDGALGLAVLHGEFAGLAPLHRSYLTDRYHLPRPRLALGKALAELGRIHAAMDVSDGLVADAGHIATASGCGIELQADSLPVSAAAAELMADDPGLLLTALTGGDDYEILFTAPADADLTGLAAIDPEVGISRIGRVVSGAGVKVFDRGGAELALPSTGYRHF